MMGTMEAYIQQNGNFTFDQLAFNEVDALILDEMVYLPVDLFISESLDFSRGLTIQELAQAYQPYAQHFMVTNKPLASAHRTKLLELAGKYERYRNLRVSGFQNKVDLKVQTQSAYLLIELRPNIIMIIFRGTDDLIIGWKEDFVLLYQSTIPAQTFATTYLQTVYAAYPDADFYIAGHSKGGHLALYAASQLVEKQIQQIRCLYTFDALGHHPHILKRRRMQLVCQRHIRIVPDDSIVGMMLFHLTKPTVIKSKQRSFWQHDVRNWSIVNTQLVRADTTSAISKITDRASKQFINNYSSNERQHITRIVFGLIDATDVLSINEWLKDPSKHLATMRHAYLQLDANLQRDLKNASTYLLNYIIQELKLYHKKNLSNSIRETTAWFRNIITFARHFFP